MRLERSQGPEQCRPQQGLRVKPECARKSLQSLEQESEVVV